MPRLSLFMRMRLRTWFPFLLKVRRRSCLDGTCWNEIEVDKDCIGMLIMAGAGFDPHIAPMAVEKLVGNDIYHRLGKKRAQLLSRAKIMDEALDIYRSYASQVAGS